MVFHLPFREAAIRRICLLILFFFVGLRADGMECSYFLKLYGDSFQSQWKRHGVALMLWNPYVSRRHFSSKGGVVERGDILFFPVLGVGTGPFHYFTVSHTPRRFPWFGLNPKFVLTSWSDITESDVLPLHQLVASQHDLNPSGPTGSEIEEQLVVDIRLRRVALENWEFNQVPQLPRGTTSPMAISSTEFYNDSLLYIEVKVYPARDGWFVFDARRFTSRLPSYEGLSTRLALLVSRELGDSDSGRSMEIGGVSMKWLDSWILAGAGDPHRYKYEVFRWGSKVYIRPRTAPRFSTPPYLVVGLRIRIDRPAQSAEFVPNLNSLMLQFRDIWGQF